MGRVISTALQFIDGFTKPSKQVIDSMNKMAGNIKKTAKEIQNAGKAISNVGSAMTKAITVPIAGIATAAVKTAADFEAAMSEVGAISGASAEDMAALTAKAKEMGATTAFSASESAEAMKYMAMAGWKTADMTEGIAGIMNLAAASGEDLAATSDIVTDGLTAFGMAAKESGRFADVLAAASSNANTNVSMMGESFKYCAPIAGSLGYSIEDTAVALGIMANSGVKGSQAGNALKTSLARMASGTGEVGKAMKELGISMENGTGGTKSLMEVMENLRSSIGTVGVDLIDSAGNLRQYDDIVADLSKTTKGLSQIQQIQAASTIFGKDNMAAMLTLVNAGTEDFDKLTRAIYGSAGSAETMAEKMLDNLNGQITLLKSAIEGILITVGNKLLPYIKKAVSWLQTAADYINNLSDAQVDNIIKWAGIAAAIGPALLIFGKMVTMVGTVQKSFAGAIKIFTKFKGLAGLITSPAGIVIGVLAAIAVAAVLIIKNWDQVKGYIRSFTQTIKPLVESIRTIFQGVAQFIKGVFTGDWKGALNGLKTIAGGVLSGLVNIIKVPFKLIANTVKGAVNSFKNLNIVKSIFTALENVIKNVLTKCGVDMNKFSAMINNIKTRVSSIINGLETIFGTAFNAIGKVVKAAATVIANIFGKEVSSTCSAAGAVLIAFKAVAGAAFSFIAGVIKKAMSIIVPVVKVAFGAVQGAISAAANTITSIISGVLTVFDGLITFISGVFTGNWRQAWEGVKNVFKGIIDTFAAICKAPINAVIGIINGAISGLNKINVTIPDWVPGMGGKSYGINIPTIPMLYKGTDNWQGGAAVIHDRGGEIVDLPKGSRVYPHDKSIQMARKEGERSGSGSVQITIQKLADKIEVRSDEDIDRIAEALAYKLKKVALNTGTT